MPIHACTLPGGGSGYRWGNHGECYADRADAEKQAEAAYSNGYAGDALTFDSARRMDQDGRLHVEVSNISKATVNPYLGQEIPGWKSLGLDPEKIYMLLRHPDELKKAAETFNNIPLLNQHIPVSAFDPQKDAVVGSTGTDAEFIFPYLRNSLVIWDAEAIAGVESQEQRELSCSYRYVPVMQSGTFEGMDYDGIMTEIVGNHVALVERGRAGPDVVVSDSINPMENIIMKATGKTIAVRAGLKAYLRPLLAADSKIDLVALVGAVKAATINADAKRIARDIIAKATFAADAKVKDADIEEAVKASAEEADDEEETEEEKKAREEKEKKEKRAEDDPPETKGAAKDPDDKDDKAMDARIAEAKKHAEDAAISRMRAIRQAEKDVHSILGEVAAMDSAEAVYKLALDHLGIDVTGVHPSAYASLVKMGVPKPATPNFASDAAAASGFWGQFKGIQLPSRT